MSEGNNGLRFDIYERVHLPDNVAAIEELEEIELVPRIQVIDQGEQALLKGQLVLNGIYRGQGEEAQQIALEHWIPVEISLPMTRVTSIDDITIDIDTFDVDLLSSRALNITGILSLRGISVDREQQQEESWEEEAFIASHERSQHIQSFAAEEAIETELADNTLEAEADNRSEIEEATEEAEAQDVDVRDEAEEAEQEVNAREADELDEQLLAYARIETEDNEQQEKHIVRFSDTAQHELQLHAHNEQAEQQTDEESTEFVRDDAEIAEAYLDDIAAESENSGDEQWAEHTVANEESAREAHLQVHSNNESTDLQAVSQLSASQDNAAEAFAHADEQERGDSILQELTEDLRDEQQTTEPQIAISSNNQQNDTLGIRSILQSSLREQAVQQANLEEETKRLEEEAAANTPVVDDEIEWQNLFLSKRPDQNEFRRIKMCIVQKEDTLEQIALRYSVNPRELLIHNNLHESAISEGQLLYIP